LCFSFDHTAPQCAQFRSSDHQPFAHLAVGPVSASTWFLDTGANQHVTPDLATLTDSAPYFGNNHLHVGDGNGLSISHIGHTILRSLKHTFTLSNVLNIPHITKPLLSVLKFCRDNNVYFKFHASVFYVKDLTIQAVLLSGQSNDGLYVLSESSATTIPQAYWSPCVSATADLRHRRLGHPMSRIFNLLVFKNKIMCTSRRSLVQCQACLLGKSSHMSLRPMGHKTTAPLDLIFSDVYKTYMVLSVYYQI
jgi:histone deacetylase 1/2